MSAALAERIADLDWDHIGTCLDERGYAVTKPLLDAAECRRLIAMFGDDERFRSTVDMRRLRFGAGVYRYFAYPLPGPVQTLRENLYAPLADRANAWNKRLRDAVRYPARLHEFLAQCRVAGQARPTPILFRYETDDHNALHQDLYGERAFPFQTVITLSDAEAYDGGEFVLTTQRPRAQSLVEVIRPPRGALLIFPNRYKPVLGKHKGRYYRTTIRHGVSRIRRGERYSLGIIFHDAT